MRVECVHIAHLTRGNNLPHGIEHGTPPIHVRVRLNSNGSMRLEVSDASESWQEGVGTPASGLVHRIINRLATQRGSMPWRQGQRVWFEIEPQGRDEAGRAIG